MRTLIVLSLVIPAAIAAQSPALDAAAAALLEYLKGEKARAIIRSFGYQI